MSKKQIKRRRTKQQFKTTAFLILVTTFIVVSGFIMKATVTEANAAGIPQRYKYFTSITVDRGVTLWDIAETYSSPEYEDLNDYIDEVVSINGLKDPNHLVYGSIICIPYYSDEYK